ncbi:MAG TPA: hypothetical protein VG324_24040, partial [Blastocatellia bacterium]|nr:hypothetical protein [Blastocatellia bacterium]
DPGCDRDAGLQTRKVERAESLSRDDVEYSSAPEAPEDISRWRNHRDIGAKTLPALERRRTEALVRRLSRALIPIAFGSGGFSTG